VAEAPAPNADPSQRISSPAHPHPAQTRSAGLVGGAAFFYQFTDELQVYRVALVWGTALVVVVPTAATIATPRRFGVALLAGWIWGAAALVVLHYFFIEDELTFPDTSFMLVFAGTLCALVLMVIPFAGGAGPTIRPQSNGSGSEIGELAR